MTNVTVFVFLGNEVTSMEQQLLQSKKDSYLFLLEKDLKNNVDTDSSNNIFFIDTANEESMEILFESLPNIVNLIMVPMITTFDWDRSMKRSKDLLKKLFLVTKSFYRKAMHTRNLRIWYLTAMTNVPVTKEDMNDVECMNEGIVAMSRVLGFELAKKKVLVNVLIRSKQYTSEKLEYFIETTTNKPLYMNMQSCIL